MNLLEYSNQTDKEIKLYGVTGFCECETAVGRLCFEREKAPPPSPIICLHEKISPSRVSEMISRISPVGIIAFAPFMTSKLLCVLLCSKLPYLILKDTSYPLSRHEGKICILDTEKNVLVVNPSVDALNLCGNKSSFLCLEDDAESFALESRRGILIPSLPPQDTLVKFAEENCTLPITIELPVAKSGSEDEFCDAAEEIFCAALYGNISLLLTRASNDRDVYLSQKLLHKVFCELESCGREFNGYVKKGLLTAAPSYFLLSHTHRPPDFLCIDFDMLLQNMFSCSLCDIIPDSETKANIKKIWETLISQNPPKIPLALKSSSLATSPLLDYFAQIAKISEIYLPDRQLHCPPKNQKALTR